MFYCKQRLDSTDKGSAQ